MLRFFLRVIHLRCVWSVIMLWCDAEEDAVFFCDDMLANCDPSNIAEFDFGTRQHALIFPLEYLRPPRSAPDKTACKPPSTCTAITLSPLAPLMLGSIACRLLNLVLNSVVYSPSSAIRDPRYGNVFTCANLTFHNGGRINLRVSVDSSICSFIMVAVWNRADNYIFILWFLLFSSPNFSRRRLDVCHTPTHGVA